MELCSRYQHLYDKYLPIEELNSTKRSLNVSKSSLRSPKTVPKSRDTSPKTGAKSNAMSPKTGPKQNPQLLELDRIRAQKRKRELDKLERRERNRERNEELMKSLGREVPQSQGLTEGLLKSFKCQTTDGHKVQGSTGGPSANCQNKESVRSKTQGLFSIV